MHFDFTISHVPSKELTIADALSRTPASSSSPADMELEQEATAYVNSIVENFFATKQRLQEIQECQQADTTCQKIVEYCKSGRPDKGALPSDVKPFHTVSSQLSVEHGLLLRGQRIVILPPLRRQLLSKLHSGHQGITKCRELASQSAKDYEFRHIMRSPYFPQGNGEAERAVGTIKRLLEKGGDPYKALLAYRCTPLPQIGYSPSQLLMGRMLRSSVPTSQAQRRPQLPDLAKVRVKDCQGMARQKSNHHHGHCLHCKREIG